MSTVKKGVLTYPDEWAKHLRPWGRRLFWKGERQAGKNAAREEVRDAGEGPPKRRPSFIIGLIYWPDWPISATTGIWGSVLSPGHYPKLMAALAQFIMCPL